MPKLIFMRHGESTFNKSDRFCSWIDSDLTEKGEVQAQETADKLKEFTITRIFSSNLKRSKNTAKIINKIIGLPEEAVTSSAELNERHYGILTGLTRTEARARYGNDQVQIWRRSFTGKPPDMPEDLAFMWQIPYENLPRSESLEDVSKRAPVYFQNEIRPALERGENVLVVSHGAPIRSILMELKSLTEEEAAKIEIANAEFIVVDY